MANFKLHSTYDLPGSTNFLCLLQISGFRQRQRFSTIIDHHTANSRWPAPIFLPSLPSKQDVQYVALYKICTCPRRDRHSRAFPVEDVLSACSSHRPSCPPAPCRGGSRARSALFELLLLLLVDQVLRTGGVVNDHRLTLKLRPLTEFFSFPLLPPTRNARLDYCLFPPAALRCETHLLLAAPQLTQLLSPNIIALSLPLALGIGIIASSIQSESPT